MKFIASLKFREAYRARIKSQRNLVNRFEERLDIFLTDPANPILFDHALTGKLIGYRSFSVTDDIRVVYYIQQDTAHFVDIGTHNQVYGK